MRGATQDVTVINKYTAPPPVREAYNITHLYGVHFEGTKAANVMRSGMRDADKVFVNIPLSVRTSDDKTYLTPKEFLKAAEGHWTLREGDIIIKGITDDPKAANHDFAYVISSIDFKDSGKSPHWEVSGG